MRVYLRAIAAVVSAVIMAACMALPSNAQSCNHFGTGFVTPFPYYVIPNSCVFSTYTGSWTCLIQDGCAPPPSVHELHPQCPFCGQPISLTDGNTFIEETDVRVPGLGGGLSLTRTWNSLWPVTQASSHVGLFGPNWRSNFEERVFSSGDGYIKYARGNGDFWSFYYNGTAWSPVAPATETASLVQGASYWTLSFQTGEKRLFDINSGNLISIIDRNNNTTQIGHDAIGRLISVTDPASRHLYFAYANDSSYLITSVTSDVGISLSYAYDANGRLLQITKPDQTTLNFEYDPNSFISAVKDSLGKILESHTYDSAGRGLTSSRANGVDAVTVSYPKQ